MTQPHSAQAGDWWQARQRGERLPAHELRCVTCGEPSEDAVCIACTEAMLSEPEEQP